MQARNYPAVITKAQIQVIKIAQKELGLDDDTYRELLRNNFKATSCTQLTYREGARCIKLLEKRGFSLRPKAGAKDLSPLPEPAKPVGADAKPKAAPRPKIPREGNVVRLASQAEMDKIAALSGLITWTFEDGLQRWMVKRFKIERVRTAKEAWLVIEGLKKMFEGSMKRKHGKDWWVRDFDDPAVQIYIKEHCPAEYR